MRFILLDDVGQRLLPGVARSHQYLDSPDVALLILLDRADFAEPEEWFAKLSVIPGDADVSGSEVLLGLLPLGVGSEPVEDLSPEALPPREEEVVHVHQFVCVSLVVARTDLEIKCWKLRPGGFEQGVWCDGRVAGLFSVVVMDTKGPVIDMVTAFVIETLEFCIVQDSRLLV